MYRIWDKVNKKYLDLIGYGDFDLYKEYHFVSGDGNVCKKEVGIHNTYINMCISQSNYIIEQATGIKDINGNMIYVGDICENIYSDETLYVIDKDEYGSYLAYEKYSIDECYPLFDYNNNIKIIGNIHKER